MSSTTREELEQLYNQSIKEMKEGQVVTGKIVGIKNKEVLVDVGFKSEGKVPITEFNTADLEMGREMEFLLENMENDAGVMTLSREKAMRMQGWD